MDDYKVDIRFPKSSQNGEINPDLVTITGTPDNVAEAKDFLLDAADSYLDDIDVQYQPPHDHQFHINFEELSATAVVKESNKGFAVRGGPWEKKSGGGGGGGGGGVIVSFPHQSDKTNDRIVLKGSKECVEALKKRILEIVADYEAHVTIEVEIDSIHHRSLFGPLNKVNVIQADYDVRIKFPARPKTEKDAPNGGEPKTEESEQEVAQPRSNTVLISGRKENCEKAKAALLLLVLVTITSADKSDVIAVTGTTDCVEKAKVELEKKLVDFEAEKAHLEARNFSISFQVDPQYHPKIIGKRGAVITKIRSKYDVQIQVPESKGNQKPEHPDLITVMGYEKNAEEAKEAILAIVKELEDLVTEEIEIDHRIHSRLIGSRGKNIRKVMDDYKVDIRFPKSSQNGEVNQDLVTITATPDNVAEAKDFLLDTADSYLGDIDVQYQPPQDQQFHINFEELSATAMVKESNKGFAVRGGLWKMNCGGNKVPQGHGHAQPQLDTNSAQSDSADFPAFGDGPESAPVTQTGGLNGNGLFGAGDESPTVTLNGRYAKVWLY